MCRFVERRLSSLLIVKSYQLDDVPHVRELKSVIIEFL
jgi:hypothetical protein